MWANMKKRPKNIDAAGLNAIGFKLFKYCTFLNTKALKTLDAQGIPGFSTPL